MLARKLSGVGSRRGEDSYDRADEQEEEEDSMAKADGVFWCRAEEEEEEWG